MNDRAPDELEQQQRVLAHWAQTWGLPGLERRLDVRFSARFRTSLGRCAPAKREIRLAAFLREGPPELLREVLCHEAAHAAAYERHGAGLRPHGPEWKALMREAGYAPRARLPAHLLRGVVPQRARARGPADRHPGRTRLWRAVAALLSPLGAAGAPR